MYSDIQEEINRMQSSVRIKIKKKKAVFEIMYYGYGSKQETVPVIYNLKTILKRLFLFFNFK